MSEIIGMIFIGLGIVSYIIAVYGVFRFDYMLNRIHAAGIGDTLAALLVIVGCLFLSTDLWHFIKLVLVLVFLWITSPISGNFIARVERMTNLHWKERVWNIEEDKKDGK